MLCGTARQTINPDPGHLLAGYGCDYPNEGIHDDLSVTALYLSDGERDACLLSFDLLGMQSALSSTVRSAVAAATGIGMDHIFIHCTHVHSGPIVDEYDWSTGQRHSAGEYRPEYNARLRDRSAQAALAAKHDAEACTIGYNYANVAENINRRFVFPDRTHVYIPNAKFLAGLSDQYVDRELGIVVFRKEGSPNKYKAVLTNYTAHPLCVGNSSNLVTSDYQGWLRRTVEETFGGALCVTTTGAAGDCHPLMPESGFAQARRMGTTLGSLAVSRAYDSINTGEESKLRLACRPITLRRQDGGVMETQYGLLGIGPVVFAALPGEMTACLGAHFKSANPFLKAYVMMCSHDWIGYVPSTNQFHWGGYETTSAMIEPGEGEKLVYAALGTAHELIEANPLRLKAARAWDQR